MVVLELRLFGYEFEDADVEALRREFSPIAPLRATGTWAPAGGGALELTTVLTFLGGALAEILIEKTFDTVWSRFQQAWAAFRRDRRKRGRFDPEFGRVVVRADDIEVEVNLHLDPQSPELGCLMTVLADRLVNGALRDVPIHTIGMPSRRDPDGDWERVRAEDPSGTADHMTWWVESRSADGLRGFYDAGEDRWLE